jgi:hypothetical protein
MTATNETDDSPALAVASPLLAAAATATLAICAQDWAVGRIAGEGAIGPATIAAIAGLSAILGGTKLPLLVRIAGHLGSLWALQQWLGSGNVEAPTSGLFFVSTAAFVGGAAVAGLSTLGRDRARGERRSLGTGDLIAALFAFSAYVAIGQHAAGFWNASSMRLPELAVQHALLPYAALILLEVVLGRVLASVAICLAAFAVMIVLPGLSPVDPFAAALIVALRIVGRPIESADPQASSVARPLRTSVPPAA